MELFREENTEGYTQTQLDTLNIEWQEQSKNLEEDTDEYDLQAKWFADKIARL